MSTVYEAVLFDFDGVLVDSEPVHFEVWNKILAPFGICLDWETYANGCIGISDRRMLEFLAVQVDPPVDVELLFAEYPRKKAAFRDRMLDLNAIPLEVVDMLKEVHRNYRTAVVTSSGQTEVEPLLQLAGLVPHLDAFVYGGDVKNLKPAPDPYLLAASRLGVTRALVVEDSAAGEASGRAAGFDVLRIQSQKELVPRLTRLLQDQANAPK